MPSIKSNFTIKYDDFNKIQEKILKLGFESENAINEYVHNPAAQQLISSATKELPVSKKGKQHAKKNIWYEKNDYNLAVNISNNLKGKRGSSFYYLYYVATGLGTSTEKGPNDFLERGTNKIYSKLIDGLINQLEKKIEEDFYE